MWSHSPGPGFADGGDPADSGEIHFGKTGSHRPGCRHPVRREHLWSGGRGLDQRFCVHETLWCQHHHLDCGGSQYRAGFGHLNFLPQSMGPYQSGRDVAAFGKGTPVLYPGSDFDPRRILCDRDRGIDLSSGVDPYFFPAVGIVGVCVQFDPDRLHSGAGIGYSGVFQNRRAVYGFEKSIWLASGGHRPVRVWRHCPSSEKFPWSTAGYT